LAHHEPIIIAGPTGVGKTSFAAELARRFGGEILGVDAFQVYRGLEILTAQPSTALCSEIPHHLIGILDPAEPFDAARFVALAREALADAQSRGHLPILAGGSGLYLKALTHGLSETPAPDPALRAELGALTLEELRARLDAVDPGANAQIDLNNPRRVLRALEICLLTGRPAAEFRTGWESRLAPGFRGVLLERNREELDARIAENVHAQFAAGVVDEVRRLGESCGPTARRSIGLREIRALLRGEITEDTCRTAIITSTRRYARRQLTWFRNQFSFPVIDLTGLTTSSQIPPSALAALGLS